MSIHSTAIIHPTAIIHDGAILDADVFVGPYCIIGSAVHLKKGVVLKSHVCVDGDTEIGEGTIVYPFASLGQPPQDLKFEGEDSKTIIGDRCTIREYVSIQKGTKTGAMETKVGSDCLLMVGVHVAHDCVVGNHVVMANYVSLAGHVHVGNHVVIGGLSAVQQFTRIGDHAMIGGMSGVEKDVIPYALVMGERAHLAGLNLVGLRRFGYDNKAILALQKGYEDLFLSSENRLQDRVDKLMNENDLIQNMKEFLTADSKRRFCMPREGK
ncbi:MAG: Acyl-[acyl-carrier-protein]--UDP-N-acetylglucosamine O-acyltransferase [Holosporales bacterium]